MTNKNLFLKNILATASTLAITLGAVDALAAAVHVPLNNLAAVAPATTDVDLVEGGAGTNMAVNQNSLQLVQDDTTLKIQDNTVPNALTIIRGIDTNGKANAVLEAGAQDFLLGVVVDSTATNAKLNINFTAANVLTLTGAIEGAAPGTGIQAKAAGALAVADAVENDYSALGNIDFKAHDATVKLELADPTPTEITGDIGSTTTTSMGKLHIVDGDINFSGKIGSNDDGAGNALTLSAITVDTAKNTRFSGEKVNAGTITIGAATAAHAAGGNSYITFGAATAAGTEITSVNAITGVGAGNLIKIEGKATLNAAVDANISGIQIGVGSELTVKDKAIDAAAAITLADAPAKIIFTQDSYNVASVINGEAGVSQGIIEVAADNVQFNGIIGATQAIDKLVVQDGKSAVLNANATFDGSNGGGVGTSGILLGNGSTLTVNVGKVLGFAANAAIDGINAGKGHLILMNENTTVDVGANNALAAVTLNNLNAGAAVALANAVHADTLNLANASKLILNGNVRVGHIKSDGNPANLLELNGNSVINFNVGEAAPGKSLNINLTGGAAANLTLGTAAGATKIYGDITNDTAGQLTVKTGVNDMKVFGDLGAVAGQDLAQVQIGDAAGAGTDHKLTVNGNIYAPVEFQTAGSELVLLGAHDIHGTIDGSGADAKGKIAVTNGARITFNAALGNTVAINQLVVDRDSRVTLASNATFKGVTGGAAADSGIRLGRASELTIDNIDVALNGTTIKALGADQGHLILKQKNTPAQIGEDATVGGQFALDKVTLHSLDDGAGNAVALTHEVHSTTLNLTGATKLIINDNVKSNKVTSSAGNAAEVQFDAPTVRPDLEIGTDAHKLAQIQFSGAGNYDLKHIYATNIIVDDNIGVTAKSFGGTLDLHGVASKFHLANNGVAGTVTGAGKFYTEGTTTITKDIGSAVFEMQGAGSVVTIDRANITAAQINQTDQTLRLARNVSFVGNYSANGSIVEVGDHKLTLGAGNLHLEGNNTITLNYDADNATHCGQIDARAVTGFDIVVGSVTTVNVNVTKAPAPGTDAIFMATIVPVAGVLDGSIVFNFVGADAANLPAVRTMQGTFGTFRFAATPVVVTPATVSVAKVVEELKKIENITQRVHGIEEQFSKLDPKNTSFDSPEVNTLYDALNVAASSVKTSEDKQAIIHAHTQIARGELVGLVKSSPEERKKVNSYYIDMLHAVQDDKKADPAQVLELAGLQRALAETANTSSERIVHMIIHASEKNFDLLTTQATAAKAQKTEDAQHKSVATSAVAHAGAAVNSAMDGAGARLASVINVPAPSISTPGSDLQTSSAEGVAAGSSVEKHGVWGQVMGGVATQKARKGAAGFKSNMIGSMIGADTMVNDNATIGFAFGNVANNVKMKDIQKGDKTKSSSWVFSGYGNYKFDNDFFISGAVAYTRTAVDNKDQRTVTATKSGIARAKYNINSFGGELTLGKAFAVKDFTVIPSIGARLTHTGKVSYKETGNTGLNGKVSQGAMNSMYGVAGLQVMKSFAYGSSLVTPEAHANVQYGLGMKTPKGKFTSQLDNKAVSYVGNKPSRFSSTIGAGVMAASGAFEYGVAYDANIAAGYVGHQGTVKLKVKF